MLWLPEMRVLNRMRHCWQLPKRDLLMWPVGYMRLQRW